MSDAEERTTEATNDTTRAAAEVRGKNMAELHGHLFKAAAAAMALGFGNNISVCLIVADNDIRSDDDRVPAYIGISSAVYSNPGPIVDTMRQIVDQVRMANEPPPEGTLLV